MTRIAFPTAGNQVFLKEVNNSYKKKFSPLFEINNPEKFPYGVSWGILGEIPLPPINWRQQAPTF